MPSPWETGFQRMADVVAAAARAALQQRADARLPPPVQQGPPPPLTIHPQVGPVEQMMQRAMRERGLGPEAWQVAKQTPVRMVPMEQYIAEGQAGGGNYDPNTGSITLGHYGDMGGQANRINLAHELRHSYQGKVDSPDVPSPGNPDNPQYMDNFNRWAATDPQAAGALQSVQGGVERGVYSQVDPWELDARIAAGQQATPDNPMHTYEQIPPSMQPSFSGWFQPGARPDPWSQQGRGWQPHYRPGWR